MPPHPACSPACAIAFSLLLAGCAREGERFARPSGQPRQPGDVAPFGRVVTSDPARLDGARAKRIEEFRADELFLDTEVFPEADGTLRVPVWKEGAGCIGLAWAERRPIRELGLRFAGAVPKVDDAQVQAWIGRSVFQGAWKPYPGTLDAEGDRWRFRPDEGSPPEFREGLRKIRWVFAPPSAAAPPIALRGLTAFTTAQWDTVELWAGARPPARQVEIEVYNGEIVASAPLFSIESQPAPPGDPGGSPLLRTCDLAGPLRLTLRVCRPDPASAERTVLRFRLPGRAFGVAVDDVLSRGRVEVEEAGVSVARDPAAFSAAAPPGTTAERKTVLQEVRDRPDQTFAQALAKTRNPIQDNGPMMLSLACDNGKFVIQREGAVQLGSFAVLPRFGSGKNEKLSRRLHGGWLPVPVTTVEEGPVACRQRTFVVPFDKDGPPHPWLNPKPLGVMEFTLTNASDQEADASLTLAFHADAKTKHPAALQAAPGGAVAALDGRLLAVARSDDAGPLAWELPEAGIARLGGRLPAKAEARARVYVPAWAVKAEDHATLAGGEELLRDVETYWTRVLAGAARIEVPDPLLLDVIRASQVHCLIAARNEEDGKRVAAWIASMHYGPLESESHSVIRGMDLLGHHEFARRALDYFVYRYSPDGMLTTGYTLMGAGWHLWTLGEHFALTRDEPWMKEVAEPVARACGWIARQRAKTMRPDARGGKPPEHGLMPPGVMADWHVYAYYYCLNGYYCAGLREAARALEAAGHPDAGRLLAEADAFRDTIRGAYRWTQSRMPVYPLRDGRWVPGYPSQVTIPGPTALFFPGADANRSWCYDVELGAHQLVPQGILDPDSPEVADMMDHLEDVQFLSEGWYDYPAARSREDWFNLGGFSKVQPYYTRNGEIYAMRDDVKPFIRSYFNALATLLNLENLSLWEHFNNKGAWNKTHETGYFLQQTRFLLAMEHGEELWLAPFVPAEWMKDGQAVAVDGLPTRFGPVGYRITSRAASGAIEAEVRPPARSAPKALVIRLRHPEGKRMRSVTVNGAPHAAFDAAKEIVLLAPAGGTITIRAEY